MAGAMDTTLGQCLGMVRMVSPAAPPLTAKPYVRNMPPPAASARYSTARSRTLLGTPFSNQPMGVGYSLDSVAAMNEALQNRDELRRLALTT